MRKFNSNWIDRNVYYEQHAVTDGCPHFRQYERPVIVCLCGSTRFYQSFQKANYDLTMAGQIVLSVGFYPHSSTQSGHGEGVGHDSAEKVMLDKLHFRKIDLADEIFVVSEKWYIGSSTRNEIDYAVKLGKAIRWMEPEAEANYYKAKVCS